MSQILHGNRNSRSKWGRGTEPENPRKQTTVFLNTTQKQQKRELYEIRKTFLNSILFLYKFRKTNFTQK